MSFSACVTHGSSATRAVTLAPSTSQSLTTEEGSIVKARADRLALALQGQGTFLRSKLANSAEQVKTLQEALTARDAEHERRLDEQRRFFESDAGFAQIQAARAARLPGEEAPHKAPTPRSSRRRGGGVKE